MKKISFLSLLLLLFSINLLSQEIIKNKDVSFSVLDIPPIFPGCENLGSVMKTKKCFSIGIQKLFIQNFDKDLPNQLGLKAGNKVVYIAFKISKDGIIQNIIVKAPHERIKEEVTRVMNLMPKVVPGEVKGCKVGVKYSIPFTLIIEETKEARRARKKRERKLRRNKNKS